MTATMVSYNVDNDFIHYSAQHALNVDRSEKQPKQKPISWKLHSFYNGFSNYLILSMPFENI